MGTQAVRAIARAETPILIGAERTETRGARPLGGLAFALTQMVATWTQRVRERQALAKLDDRALRDIGVSRSEIGEEMEKPFWRA